MLISTLKNLHASRDGRGVVTVWLDVPGRAYNVLGEEVFANLSRLLDDLEMDPGLRLVLFRSGKSSGFLAGADLREILALADGPAAERLSLIGQTLFGRFERFRVPMVAAIDGPCLGGGLEFALACRYRLAEEDARTQFGAPEVELGLVPAWGATQRLRALVGLSAAISILLDGRRLSAGQAAELGLVDRVWPSEMFERGIDEFIADRLEGRPLRRRPPGLVRTMRDSTRLGQRALIRAARQRIAARSGERGSRPAAIEAIERGLFQGRDAGLARERAAFAELLFTPACRELVEQFFDRKRPRDEALDQTQNA